MLEMGIYSSFHHPWVCAPSEISYPIEIFKLPNTTYYNHARTQMAQKMDIYTEARENECHIDVPF